jgi:hypothetical protein
MLTLLVASPAEASTDAGLRYVGASTAPARSDDGHTALLTGNGSVVAVDHGGRVHEHPTPPGCAPRRLRFPWLVLACVSADREQPAVLDVATGQVQRPPAPSASDLETRAADSFFAAGRFWIDGVRTYANGGQFAVLQHRFTGAVYVYTGVPDLDSPTYRVTPENLGSKPCGPFLTQSSRRLRIIDCDTSSVVKRCPRGCYAAINDLVSGAYVEHDQVGQVALASARVVRTWRLPARRRDRVSLVLTDNAVFASLLVAGSWRVFRGELDGYPAQPNRQSPPARGGRE